MQQRFSTSDQAKADQVRKYITQQGWLNEGQVHVNQSGSNHEVSFEDDDLDIKTTDQIRQYAVSQGLTNENDSSRS